jgi:voltage-gated potassium channel
VSKANLKVISLWHVIVLFMCIFVLLELCVEAAFDLPPHTEHLLNIIDNFICAVFIADFFYQLWKAPKKLNYFFTWGWIDLISSIPNVQFLRWGRAVRVIRIFRLLRGFRSTRMLMKYIFRDRAKGTFLAVSLITFVLIVASAIAVLNFEIVQNGTIKTPGEALWWAIVTVTTVGYGDYIPVTLGGRIVAAVLMLAGVALLGTFTAYIANYFVETSLEVRKEQAKLSIIMNEFKELKDDIAELREELKNTKGQKKKL